MTCIECSSKMKCTYTAPVGNQRVRYRVYKCPTDGKYQESIEIPVQAISQLGTIQARIEEARSQRFGIIKRLHR